MKYRLFPLYTSLSSRKSASKLTLGSIDAQLTSPCSFMDCSFDTVNMCNYKSDDYLQDDEDLLLGIFIENFFLSESFSSSLEILLS